MKKTKKNNKGFSLVELIVVIAIMAVLVGVLAPTLLKNIEKSRYSKDIQALDSINTAVTMVLSDETASAAIVDGTYNLATLMDRDASVADVITSTLSAELLNGASLETDELGGLESNAFETTALSEVEIVISGSGTAAAITVTSDDADYDAYTN